MAVNVFNWCCWAVVLAVIIDAQPTVDETVTCSASTLEDIAKEIKDVKQLLHTPRPIELDAGSPSKQALVSALVCEYRALLLVS